MSELRCETCRHWDQWDVGFGLCRVDSPMICPTDGTAAWPSSRRADWCGEHEARMELPIAEDRAQLMADVISGKVTGHK